MVLTNRWNLSSWLTVLPEFCDPSWSVIKSCTSIRDSFGLNFSGKTLIRYIWGVKKLMNLSHVKVFSIKEAFPKKFWEYLSGKYAWAVSFRSLKLYINIIIVNTTAQRYVGKVKILSYTNLVVNIGRLIYLKTINSVTLCRFQNIDQGCVSQKHHLITMVVSSIELYL